MSEFAKMIELMESEAFHDAFNSPPDGRQRPLLRQLAASPWTMAEGDLYLVKCSPGGIPGVFKLFHDTMKSCVLQGDPQLAECTANAFLSFLDAMRVQKDVCHFHKGEMGGEECARQVSECLATMIHSPNAIAGSYQRLFARAQRLEMVNLFRLFSLVPGLNITTAA